MEEHRKYVVSKSLYKLNKNAFDVQLAAFGKKAKSTSVLAPRTLK
jgi:hypothetical protein